MSDNEETTSSTYFTISTLQPTTLLSIMSDRNFGKLDFSSVAIIKSTHKNQRGKGNKCGGIQSDSMV